MQNEQPEAVERTLNFPTLGQRSTSGPIRVLIPHSIWSQCNWGYITVIAGHFVTLRMYYNQRATPLPIKNIHMLLSPLSSVNKNSLGGHANCFSQTQSTTQLDLYDVLDSINHSAPHLCDLFITHTCYFLSDMHMTVHVHTHTNTHTTHTHEYTGKWMHSPGGILLQTQKIDNMRNAHGCYALLITMIVFSFMLPRSWQEPKISRRLIPT